MQQKHFLVFVNFLVVLLMLNARAGVESNTDARRKRPDIRGTVIDGTQNNSAELIEKYCKLAVQMRVPVRKVLTGDKERFKQMMGLLVTNRVQILNPKGPVSNAEVFLQSWDTDLNPKIERSTKVSKDGTFEFYDLPNGTYKITATNLTAGASSGLSSYVVVKRYRRSTDSVRIVISPLAVTLTGRITDSKGNPLEDVIVYARQGHEYYREEGDFTESFHEASARTDENGIYELKGLIPANAMQASGLNNGGYGHKDIWYSLKVEKPGFVALKNYIPIVPESVRKAAQIYYQSYKDNAGAHQRVRMQKSEPINQPACKGTVISGVDFTLYKPAKVKGVVVDAHNNPKLGCSVTLQPTNIVKRFSCKQQSQSRLWTNVDEKGQFVLFDVPPDTYRLKASDSGRQSKKEYPLVTVKEGEDLIDLGVVNDATPLGEIQGVVIDAESGVPVRDFDVRVRKMKEAKDYSPSLGRRVPFCRCRSFSHHSRECQQWRDKLIREKNPNASAFAIEKVSPGVAELLVKADGYADGLVDVPVKSGEIVKPTVRMHRECVVHVRYKIENESEVDHYMGVPGKSPLIEYLVVPKDGGSPVSLGRSTKNAGYEGLKGISPGEYFLLGSILYLKDGVQRSETVPVNAKAACTNEVPLDFTGPCEIKLSLDFEPGFYVNAILETADTPPGDEWERNSLGKRARVNLREPAEVLIPDLKPGRYRLSIFKHSIDKKKNKPLKDMRPVETRIIDFQNGAETSSFKINLN